jgi:hypothetical protein
LGLEGEIAVKVDLGLFGLPPAFDAGLFVGAAGPGIAEDALAIELLFEAAEGLIDRLAAFEPDFNHARKPYRKRRGRGRYFLNRGEVQVEVKEKRRGSYSLLHPTGLSK